MRNARLIAATVVALLALATGAPAATHHTRPHCQVPHGWHVVARNTQAVVIASLAGVQYRYCLRSTGRFRFLAGDFVDLVPGESVSVFYVVLSGEWASYWTEIDPFDPTFPKVAQVHVRSLVTNKDRSAGLGEVCAYPSTQYPPLLTPNGIAAWVTATCNLQRPCHPDCPPPPPKFIWTWLVQAFDGRTGSLLTLEQLTAGESGGRHPQQSVRGRCATSAVRGRMCGRGDVRLVDEWRHVAQRAGGLRSRYAEGPHGGGPLDNCYLLPAITRDR
jgi:hypothetical protein